MEEDDFEGTLVLEKIAAINEIDSFYDAIDSDDFRKAVVLMRRAGVDEATITTVVQKMKTADE